jgi:hypothetical protein
MGARQLWLEWELIIQQGEPRFNNISKMGGERSIDTIGPFEPDEHGNTYIIAAVAGFSRFVMLEAANDASGTAAAKFLLKITGIFGRPGSLRHDGGAQFEIHLADTFRCGGWGGGGGSARYTRLSI